MEDEPHQMAWPHSFYP